MTTPQITDPPPSTPARSMDQATFDTSVIGWLDWFKTFVPQLRSALAWFQTTASEVEANAAAAATAAGTPGPGLAQITSLADVTPTQGDLIQWDGSGWVVLSANEGEVLHRSNGLWVGNEAHDALPIASSAAAEDGTDNETFMTPLRTAQAINALAGAKIDALENRRWHDETANRSANIWYQNTATHSIDVHVNFWTTGGTLYVNNDAASSTGEVQVGGPDGDSGTWDNAYATVPPGAFYRGTNSARAWSELK